MSLWLPLDHSIEDTQEMAVLPLVGGRKLGNKERWA